MQFHLLNLKRPGLVKGIMWHLYVDKAE